LMNIYHVGIILLSLNQHNSGSIKSMILSRILAREGFLWCEPTQVSQQALSQRFLTFPAEIFERIFKPTFRWLKRPFYN
jgi:hypothetical protein